MSNHNRERHERRVRSAASRAARLDEQGILDDWAQRWLMRVRHEALTAGLEQANVDDLTMDGVIDGRGSV